jgi:prepilin-type processing-associated H-X9-DG protein
MRRMRLGLGLATSFLFCFSIGAAAQPLADRVPGDALVYVGWTGSESMPPAYAGSHLKAVLDESKFADFVNGSIPKLLQKAGMANPQAGQVAQLVTAIGGPLLRHPTAFYFGGIEMPAGGQGPPTPKVALLCDAGAEGKALADLLRNLLAQAQGAPFKVEEQGGLVVLSAGANGWGAAQKPAAALSAAKGFTAALAQVQQKDSVIAAYVDVEAILAQVDAVIGQSPQGQKWADVRDALGLKGVKRGIVTAGFDGKDWSSQAFVDVPAPRTGPIPGLFDAKPLTDDILKTIPQSATVAMAGKFDIGALINAIKNGVAKLDPNAGDQVAGAIGQVNQMLGLDIQKDLFDLFGEEWAVYMDPLAAGNGLLGVTVVNKTRGGEKLEASLSKLEDMANAIIKQQMKDAPVTLSFSRVPIGGTTLLHQFAIPLITPAWAIKDGNWYFGLYPQVVEAALEQGGGKNKSILDNEDYVALRKRLGNQPASGVSFANLPRTAPESSQQVLMMSRLYFGFADLFGGEVPPMLLPPLRKIMPHLAPAGGVSWSDPAGWHYKDLSPFPLSGALTPGGGGQMLVAQQAFLASILLPSLNRAREQANRVKCASNMHMIGNGILLYANDHKGKYPADLGTLLKEEDLPAQVFVCPTEAHATPPGPANPDAAAKWVNENSDYVYVGAGKTSAIGADVVVMYEKPDAHNRQGMNILFGDGHIEFVTLPDAMRMIQAQQQAPKKGGGL